MGVIEPRLSDDALLADIEAAPRDADCVCVWWLGQSGFLLQWAGHRLLFDPYLSDTLTEKYAGTSKPHVRISRRTVDPGRLTGSELVTATHGHTDHLDPATLQPIMAANPAARLIAPEAVAAIARERLGPYQDRLLPIDAGRTLTHGVWEIEAIPAAHEAIERDGSGFTRCLGYIVRAGRFSIYHAGDTVRYEGQAERLRQAHLDLALLPINGRDPARGVSGNLTGEEAAELARDANARLAIPCHYDMFAFNTASPDAFVARAARLGQRVTVLALGERLELTP